MRNRSLSLIVFLVQFPPDGSTGPRAAPATVAPVHVITFTLILGPKGCGRVLPETVSPRRPPKTTSTAMRRSRPERLLLFTKSTPLRRK